MWSVGHVAPLSQILNLKNNELDEVANLLADGIHVHWDKYRLPKATTQLAKISKLQLEKGHIPKLHCKCLDDIETDGMSILM